ncbi:hypothetical protein [Citricoccus sp. GCM10030269]|uniref:hypothetical protein n=1 Tax=Citricoccus sp. GCM10030269 TaxID=3273388 RepID=UPI00361AF74D
MAAAATTESRTARGATGLAVALTAGSVPLHAWMLTTHSHSPVLTALMTVMVLWCMWCAVGVIRSAGPGSRTALRHLWVMAVAMIALHVVLLTGPLTGLLAGQPDAGGHHHAPGPAAVGPAVGAATSDTAGTAVTGLMLTVVALELAVCFACAVALRAHSHLSRLPRPLKPAEAR